MTQREFNLIKERLADWRSERGLTYENQREEFLGNVFEKVSEYFRAKDDLERVEALCDIAVFCFNVFDTIDFDYYYEFRNSNENIEIYKLTDAISEVCYREIKKLYAKPYIPLIISYCQYLCKNLGFDFYKCMLEKIKEIESRTGFYDERLNRFVEKIGAYCEREAFDLAINDFKLTNVPNKYFLDKEGSDFWCIRIEDNNGDYEDYYIRKWYKADYESCRL
ncbi:hypothetical protein RII42_001959 [Campylobacter jejuni]|nr:hypothetical protein [Campylobacter jejuni]EAH8997267.1 hypothetical protein [Campylobacter jejuni]EAH9533485.1 hypothetical protein [Campylobacter jejuni]EAI6507428.1 hypothetical protein [Campylobacter jejuni]EAI7433889.1 hypothetical protein [Campylobacter jejuni]